MRALTLFVGFCGCKINLFFDKISLYVCYEATNCYECMNKNHCFVWLLRTIGTVNLDKKLKFMKFRELSTGLSVSIELIFFHTFHFLPRNKQFFVKKFEFVSFNDMQPNPWI